MASSAQEITPYDLISEEDTGGKWPAEMIKMSTFGYPNDARSTDYLPGSAFQKVPLGHGSDSSSSGPVPRFASWKKPSFKRKDAPRSASWKPFTFKAGFLIPLFLVTCGFIVALEVLRIQSDQNGGLLFANSLDSYVVWQTFLYRYLPTIIAVTYGMVLAILDLDVKRLEPYFQLSKLEGASGKDSILLNYPFEFLAYVPIASFYRRHWAVFLSGFSLVLTFWVITPLQSSILATEVGTRIIQTSFVLSKEFIPFDQQAAELTAQFEYAAYGTTWLGEEIAPFLTKGYMAVPFKRLGDVPDHVVNGRNESWTTTTRVYSTKVDCKPAGKKYENLGTGEGSMWYLTDYWNTCTLGVTPISSGTRNMQYFGIGENKGLDSFSISTGCNDTSLFVGIWAQAANETTPPGDNEISAIFCRTSYYYADAAILIDGATLRIIEPQTIEPSAQSTALELKDKIIDFETVEMDMVNVAQMGMNSTGPYIYRIGPSSTLRFDSWGLSNPSRMIGYIIASGNGKTFGDFKDPDIFGNAVEKAHRLLFSNALYFLLQPIPAAKVGKPVAGTRLVTSTAVVMVTELVRILEGCLAFVGLCIVVLFFIYRHRRNNLFSDPDSLSAKMSLVADSKHLLKDFEGLDECPDLGKCIPGSRYQLDGWSDGVEHYRLDRLHSHLEDTQMKLYNPEHAVHHTGAAVIPFELRNWAGITFTTFLLGLLTFLCFLYKSNLENSGLSTLAESQIGVQIIYSFIPTAIATFIEPFWIIVTRAICAYQPYIQLQKGNASASSSLGVKYTNLPAALIFPRALRSRNFLVASVSAVSLLANFLAVAFGGLFENAYLPLPGPDTFTQTLAPLINSQMRYGEEQYLLANTNITAGTALPPFVTPEFYFLPFTWNTTGGNSSDLHTAVTRGFGGNVACQPLESESFHLEYYTPITTEAGSGQNASDQFWGNNFNVTVPVTGGSGTVNCTAYPVSDSERDPWTKNFAELGSLAAGEYMLDLEPTSQDADQNTWDKCLSILIIGWARGTISYSNNDGSNFTFVPGTYKSTTLLCQQEIFSAEFEVVVDKSQRVQSYTRVGPFDVNNPVYFEDVSLTNFTAQMGRLFMAGSRVGGTSDDLADTNEVDASIDKAKFHNDSTALLFPHGLIGTLLNDTELADPTTPVPEFELLEKGVQNLYGLLFAISLGLNSDRIFVPTATGISISGTTTTEKQRMSMSNEIFYITAVLLGLNVLVGITTWILRPMRFFPKPPSLPRFPDSIAAEIGFFHASQALRDVSGTASLSSRAREKHLESLGHKYGYGVYISEYGVRRRGVERQSRLSSATTTYATKALYE